MSTRREKISTAKSTISGSSYPARSKTVLFLMCQVEPQARSTAFGSNVGFVAATCPYGTPSCRLSTILRKKQRLLCTHDTKRPGRARAHTPACCCLRPLLFIYTAKHDQLYLAAHLRARAGLRGVACHQVKPAGDGAALLPAAALGGERDGLAPPRRLPGEDVHPAWCDFCGKNGKEERLSETVFKTG